MIKQEDIKIADLQASIKWGIDIGDRYTVMKYDLISSISGDEGPCQKLPLTGHEGMNIGLVKAHMFKRLLNHSRYSWILILASVRSGSDKEVQYVISKHLNELANLKTLVVHSVKAKSWVCMYHDFRFCSDWVYECKVLKLLSHSSDYCFHGIVLLINGTPTAVKNEMPLLKRLFDANLNKDNFNWDFKTLHENKANGFYLTNTECIRWMHKKFLEKLAEKQQEDIRTGKGDKWNNEKYVKLTKTGIATANEIYTNDYQVVQYMYKIVGEMFHGFDNYIHTQVSSMILQSHCVDRWSIKDSLSIMLDLDTPFIVTKCNKFLNENAQGILDKPWIWNSNGDGFKKMCDMLNYTYLEASWIAYAHAEDDLKKIKPNLNINDISSSKKIKANYINDDTIDWSIFLPMWKIACKYEIHRHSRRGFGIAWSSNIPKYSKGARVPILEQMIQHFRRSWEIAYQWVPELVSLDIF